MTYEFCKVEREGRLTIVTLNRPEVMNALHAPAHAELAEVFDAFAADPEQWVAIVTGAGDRAFSAGNDLKVTAAGGGSGRITGSPSGAPGEALELGPALGLERLPALAGLLGAVEEQVRVVGQLLDTGHAVFGRVEAGLHQPQRER